MKYVTHFLLFVLAMLVGAGCTVRVIEIPMADGRIAKYKSTTFLTNPTIGPVTFKSSPYTGTEFGLQGYTHEQLEAMRVLSALGAKILVAP